MSIFNGLPLMGILRGIRIEEVSFVAEIVQRSGLNTLEITMNTDDASRLISKMRDASQGRFTVGAGTVRSMKDLAPALDAGAAFIVMPTLVKEVVDACVKENIPVFPGALTPQEIWDAHCSGATMVKVFPSNLFGPSYFKDLRGPFNDTLLMACGGVSADNLADFFDAGANAVSFGASIFKREWLSSHNEEALNGALGKMVDAYRSTRC